MDQGGFFPADVGPGPNAEFQLEAEIAALDLSPQPAFLLRLADGVAQPGKGEGIFGPHINEAPACPHGIGRDRHALQQAMGIPFHHGAVHEGTGVALIGVAHHQLFSRWLVGYGRPFEARGVTRSPASPQAAAADRRHHRLGSAVLQHLGQLLVSTGLKGFLDRFRIDLTAVLQDPAPLQAEEGMVEVDRPGAWGTPALQGILGCRRSKTLGQLPCRAGLESSVELGSGAICGQHRSLTTGAQTAHPFDRDFAVEVGKAKGLVEGDPKLFAAEVAATGCGAEP